MRKITQFIISFQLRFLKRKVIKNLFHTKNLKRALLYYKTDPFFSKKLINSYSHTNNSEIVIMSNLLKKHGFILDVIDRSANWKDIQVLQDNQYDLFLGIGSGNFKYFNKIKKYFNIYKTVLIATGPEPIENNNRVNKASIDCNLRNNFDFKVRRLIEYSDESILQRYHNIDSVFYYGNKSTKEGWSFVSDNLFNILPSVSPLISFSLDDLQLKEKNRFIYFAASGLVCKGLDIVIEAFDGLDNVILDICAPFDEDDFWSYYKPIVDRNSSINLHGFVTVGSCLFYDLTSKATFNLFPATSEGCATSVTTLMRRAVIPVITKESGLDEKSSQFTINHRTPQGLRKLIFELCNIGIEELNDKTINTYIDSFAYSVESFTNTFESSLIKTILLDKKNVND